MGAKILTLSVGQAIPANAAGDYQGIYIEARKGGRDNPQLSALFTAAQASKLPFGWYIVLNSGGAESYGVQIRELATIHRTHKGGLSPAIVIDSLPADKLPKQFRGDFLSYYDAFMGDIPRVLICAGRAVIDKIFTENGDTETLTNFRKAMLNPDRTRLWLINSVISSPFVQWHVLTSGVSTTWRGDAAQFYKDNELPVPPTAPVTPPPTTPVSAGRTFGLDVSLYQDNNSTPQKVDWVKAKAAGAEFAFIRASQGNSITDEDFSYNWQAAKSAGLLRGAYHFYDYRVPARPQAERFVRLLWDDLGELPPVIDYEVLKEWGRPPRAGSLAAIYEFVTVVKAMTGKTPIFYSNPDMILNILKPIPEWLKALPLWVAHYGVTKPSIGDWADWKFWQYGIEDGLKYGMESKEVDPDYYNGSLAELRAWIGIDTPPAPELTLEEKVARLWAAHPEVW